MALFKQRRTRRIESAENAGYSIEVGTGWALAVPTRGDSLGTYVPLESLNLPTPEIQVPVTGGIEQPA